MTHSDNKLIFLNPYHIYYLELWPCSWSFEIATFLVFEGLRKIFTVVGLFLESLSCKGWLNFYVIIYLWNKKISHLCFKDSDSKISDSIIYIYYIYLYKYHRWLWDGIFYFLARSKNSGSGIRNPQKSPVKNP